MTAALTFPEVSDLPPRLRLVPDPAGGVVAPPGEPGPSRGPAVARPCPSVAPEVYRRRRLAVLAVVAGLVLGAASFGRAQATTTTSGGGVGTDAVVLVVQPGDTLWGIADALSPGHDPRPLVHELTELAGTGPLEPGQQLVIPRSLVD